MSSETTMYELQIKTNKKIMKNYNRELGFVLMVLNIREVTAQRAENNQKL